MQQQQDTHDIQVTWRGKKFIAAMTSSATLNELGNTLQKLTDVKSDTLKLIVRSSKGSKFLSPFSDEHSSLSLLETSIFEVRSIMMMGVPKDEVDQVLRDAKADARIAGFDEEEKRLKQRMLSGSSTPLKLPQGNYVFCEFRTLHIPGLELTPPASEALKVMHMLAADPGIIAIMNKHRWRIGIMTEMAPEGYVGVSAVCILGFNKNQGEEISLRLRTDDLKGFRKYQSIKKTLLHELAHMVYSEHDANFYALDKQLNQEAASLDWTRSRSQTLSGFGHSQHHEEEFYTTTNKDNISQKLGGKGTDYMANARASSVAAAYRRLDRVLGDISVTSDVREEPSHDDYSKLYDHGVRNGIHATEPRTHGCSGEGNKTEPDPDDCKDGDAMESEPYHESVERVSTSEPDPDDSEMTEKMPTLTTEKMLANTWAYGEPDPDDSEVPLEEGLVSKIDQLMESMESHILPKKLDGFVVQDDSGESRKTIFGSNSELFDGNSVQLDGTKNHAQLIEKFAEPDPDDSRYGEVHAEPDPDDGMVPHDELSRTNTNEPDPDDQELQRIQDPVTAVCSRLQKAIKMLQSEVGPSDAVTVLQTLFKIIRNVIEHPEEIKFRKLRKTNPIIQRHVANYKAAMEILLLIGFIEDVMLDEIGKVETYLILKRNDPGLLWLAKSSLETSISC